MTLAASLAAFGCTTNRTPGNGDPLQGAPGAGPGVPTSGVSGGSSSGTTTTTNPPMISSSTYNDALPSVNARSTRLPLSPDEAAAVLAGNQLNRGVRILGPSNPGSAGRNYASDGLVTGQFQNPALRLNPIVTVNSSINSAAHVPAVGAGEGGSDAGVAVDAATFAAAVTNAGTTAATVADGSGAVLAPATAVTTPTAAAVPFGAGSFAAGPGSPASLAAGTTLAATSSGSQTPTAVSGGLPTPTVASSATVSTTAASTAPVRVTQDADGRVIVTNANTRAKSQ